MQQTKKRPAPLRINGVLVLDKPTGISSNGALQRVKRLFNAAKAGHTGSLDPLATGVLPICLGEATKFAQWSLDADKAYEALARLGQVTDTADAEGQVLEEHPVPVLSAAQVEAALAQLRGTIEQVPPKYSALKHQGQPLYKLARKGIEVEIKPRQVQIHQLDCLAIEPGHLRLRVHCSKGTYIRTLVEDLGRLLGCGAHVAELRRLISEPFELAQAETLEALEQLKAEQGMAGLRSKLLPVETLLHQLPVLVLEAFEVEQIIHGQSIKRANISATAQVQLRGPNDELLGLGELRDDGQIWPRRLVRLD